MTTSSTHQQRHRDQRSTFVTPAHAFDPRGWEVAPMPTDAPAKAFVVQHHYLGSYPAALRRFGLYAPGGVLSGVAVFSVPVNDRALRELPCPPREACELGRLVLLDSAGFNAETWFVSRAFHALRREGWAGVMSMSDPVPRVALDGRVQHRGHIGTIYQALSAVYVGRASPATLCLLPDGRTLHPRALSKVRNAERGWQHVAAQLEGLGAPPRGDTDPGAWLAAVLPTLTRRLRHPGNHKYLWAFDRAGRRTLGPLHREYPRFPDA